MAEEINKLMYGEDHFNKLQAFEKCIETLKEKHKDWFKERIDNLPEEEREHAYFHDYQLRHFSDTNYTNFEVDKGLPEEIKNDFADCFTKHFGGHELK